MNFTLKKGKWKEQYESVAVEEGGWRLGEPVALNECINIPVALSSTGI